MQPCVRMNAAMFKQLAAARVKAQMGSWTQSSALRSSIHRQEGMLNLDLGIVASDTYPKIRANVSALIMKRMHNMCDACFDYTYPHRFSTGYLATVLNGLVKFNVFLCNLQSFILQLGQHFDIYRCIGYLPCRYIERHWNL